MGRKITVNLYMTLDGYGEFPEYPGSDIEQKEPDVYWKDMWSNRYGNVDTIIYGHNSYEGHAQYHALSKRKSTDPEFLFDFSKFLEKCTLVILSSTIKKADWGNTRIMSGDLVEIVSNLKEEEGKDIIVDAGPSLVHEFIQKGLADDYRMLIFPVLLGKGHHYWGTMLNQQTLRLVKAQSLKYGELYLHYEAVRN